MQTASDKKKMGISTVASDYSKGIIIVCVYSWWQFWVTVDYCHKTNYV